MNQAPLPGTPARKAVLDNHVKAIASGDPRRANAAVQKLTAMNASPAEHRYVQIEAQKRGAKIPAWKLASPAVTNAGSPAPKYSRAQTNAIQKNIEASPQVKAHQAAENYVKGPYAREQSQLAAMVDPVSHQNLQFAAEGLTGYHEIRHIGSHPIAGGLALASILPFGRAAHIVEEARAAEAGVKAAKEGEGLKGALAARKAVKAARRGPKMLDPAERHAYLTELSRQASEDPKVQAAMHQHKVNYLEPGETTPETGGEVGAKVRQAMRPTFKGMGKYEKIGAKQDNPGLAELRKQQEELRGPERSRKAGVLHAAQQSAFAAARESTNPIRTAAKARAALKGELPAKVFKGFDNLTHEEQLAINDHIESLPMQPHDKDNLLNAIADGLDGKVPTVGEQKLIERAFGVERPDIVSAVKAGGFKQALFNLMTIPRAIKSSGDLSWGLRQGLAAAVHSPRAWLDAFKATPKAAFSEATAQAEMQAIHEHPYFPLLVKMGVPFTEIGSAAKGVANVSDKEEGVMSNWAEHLHEMPLIRSTPGVKQAAHAVSSIVRASDRGYVIPLDKLRLQLGSQMLHQALENGWKVDGKLGNDLGEVIGALTGRGSLPKVLAKHRATINALFFSPGLMSSRIKMLNPAWYVRLEPFARQQASKSARNLTGTLLSFLFAAKMAGATVVMNPRNSDFGKIRIGNTRIDIAGGYSQYLTLYSRLATQKSISSTTGKTTSLSGKSFGTSDWDLVQNFFENKLSPVSSEAVTALKRNRFGQPLTPTGELGQMFSPLLWNDMYQLARAQGPGGGPGIAAATFLPDLFGIGVNNYAPTKKKGSSDPFSTGGSGGFGGFGSGSSDSFGGIGG